MKIKRLSVPKKTGSLILVIVCCWLLVFSANAQTLALKSVFDSIEKNNPLLLSYTEKIKSSEELVNSARTWSAPKSGMEFDKNPYAFDNFYNGTVRISMMQEFPSKKILDAKENYLRSISQIEVNESGYQRNKLFSQAKEAYYGIYIMQKNIEILNKGITILRSMIEVSEKFMATGKGDMSSIFKLKARLADKETKLIHDNNMIKSYMVTINYLMNRDVNKTFAVDTFSVFKNYKNLTFLYNKDSIECKRSDIMQMTSMINSLKLNQNIRSLQSRAIFGMKLEHYAIMDKPDMFSVMGTMTIPIAPWSARGYKSEVKAMGFSINAMEEEKQNMVNMTSQMIKMLVIEMNSEYEEIDNYKYKVIPAYQKSFDAYMLAYGQNNSDLIMILMAYDDLQMAETEYLKHLETLLKVQVDYEKEMQIQ